MLEILIFGGGSDNYLPNSGPGNKKIIVGSKEEGWLGLVDPTYMPLIQNIASAVGLTVTPFTGVNAVKPKWLKAVIGDAVIFVPNGPWTDPVSYSTQYVAGVFGVDDIGPDGIVPSGVSSRNQLKYVDWTDPDGRSWLFKVRLIKGNDPVRVTAQGNVTTASAMQSENYRLYNRVIAGTTIVSGDRWDNLVAGTDYLSFRYFDQTYIGGGAIHSLSTPEKTDVGQWWTNGTGQAFTWQPVLEVVDPDDTFIYPLGVTFTTEKRVPINSVPTTNISLITAGDFIIANQATTPIASVLAADISLIAAGALQSSGTAVIPISQTLS